MRIQNEPSRNFLLALNVIFTLILVSIWVSHILWKDSLKDVFKDLQDAIDTHNKILARTFEESEK